MPSNAELRETYSYLAPTQLTAFGKKLAEGDAGDFGQRSTYIILYFTVGPGKAKTHRSYCS
jgi:hypothetical protein